MAQITRGSVRVRKGAPTPEPKKNVLQGRKPGTGKYIRGCVFGPPKTGKRTFACSGKRILLIQFDPGGDGTQTLRGRDDITVVEPKSKEAIDEIIVQLRSGGTELFDWVVVGSVTSLFYMLGHKGIAKAYHEGTDIRRAHGAPGAEVQQIIYDLVSLPINSMFIAHLEKVSAEDDSGIALDSSLGQTEVKLAVTPMVWKILGVATDFIARSYKEIVYEEQKVDGKKVRNKRTRYMVSLNDGNKTPVGSRLSMAAEYEIVPNLLDTIATEIAGDNASNSTKS